MEDSGIVGKYYLLSTERSRIAAFTAILRSRETLRFHFANLIKVSKENAPVLFSLAGKDRGTLISTRVYCAEKLS